MLIILRAGIYTTVQDLGREGFRRLGISTGGALDQPALKIANLLVGNAPEAAGLRSRSASSAPSLPVPAGSP